MANDPAQGSEGKRLRRQRPERPKKRQRPKGRRKNKERLRRKTPGTKTTEQGAEGGAWTDMRRATNRPQSKTENRLQGGGGRPHITEKEHRARATETAHATGIMLQKYMSHREITLDT